MPKNNSPSEQTNDSPTCLVLGVDLRESKSVDITRAVFELNSASCKPLTAVGDALEHCRAAPAQQTNMPLNPTILNMSYQAQYSVIQ